MRRVWRKSGTLGTIRVWLHHLRTPEGEDMKLWDRVYPFIHIATEEAIDHFGLEPEDVVAHIEERLRESFPEQWERAQELGREYRENLLKTTQKQFRGVVRLSILVSEARLRANDRLYRPDGSGYQSCKERFEECQQKLLTDRK
jgi:hypothetical protein